MKMKTKEWVPVSVLLWTFCVWSSINGDVTAVDAAVALQQQSLGDLDNDDGNRHGSASSDASGMNPLEQQAKMYEARIQELSDSIVTLEDFITDAQLMNIAERRSVMQNSTSRSRDEGYRATTANTQRRQKTVKKKKEDTNGAPAEEEEDAATVLTSTSPSSPMIQPKCLLEKNLKEGITGISPFNYMNWSFNRAMSAITIGSKSSTTNPATTYTILGNGQGGSKAPLGSSLNGFSVTVATYNADANAYAAGVNYGVGTQLNQQSATMGTVTAITVIVPYTWDLNLASFQPDISNSDVIYFLVGDDKGAMWLCNINSSTNRTQANCGSEPAEPIHQFGEPHNLISGTISEIAYIPQSKTIVVMTFKGILSSFKVGFDMLDRTRPVLHHVSEMQDYKNDDPNNQDYDNPNKQDYGYGVYALFLPRSVAVVYINSTTTYLYVAGLYPETSAAPLMIFTMDADRTISYTGSIQNTAQTYQVIPVLTGIYFTSYGNMVSYIPFVQPTKTNSTLAPNGMLGIDPAVYSVYTAEDAHLVTSISFSSNPSNVVIYVDPTNSSTPEYAFEDGALFINVATVDHACNQTTRKSYCGGCKYPNEELPTNVADNTCFGSIFLSDACTGDISLVVENEIPGPVYTSLPGLNMDMLGQNGQGGLTFFSVAYTPGIVSNAALVTNQAFEVVCSCSSTSKLVKDLERFLAVAVLVAGVVVFPGLGAAAGVELAVATYGLVSATAGVATSFIGVIPNQPYCGSGIIGNGQCVGDLCCSQSGDCVTCPTPAPTPPPPTPAPTPAPTPRPSFACSIESETCTAGGYGNVFEQRCCDNSQTPGSRIVSCNAKYEKCEQMGAQNAGIYTPWAQCSTDLFDKHINFCEDWCGVADYWPNCGTNELNSNDPRNTPLGNDVYANDYVCSCTGCKNCPVNSSIPKCSTDQFGLNFCDDWCRVPNLWPKCGTNTVTQRTGQPDFESGTDDYEYNEYTCSCNGCNGCPPA